MAQPVRRVVAIAGRAIGQQVAALVVLGRDACGATRRRGAARLGAYFVVGIVVAVACLPAARDRRAIVRAIVAVGRERRVGVGLFGQPPRRVVVPLGRRVVAALGHALASAARPQLVIVGRESSAALRMAEVGQPVQRIVSIGCGYAVGVGQRLAVVGIVVAVAIAGTRAAACRPAAIVDVAQPVRTIVGVAGGGAAAADGRGDAAAVARRVVAVADAAARTRLADTRGAPLRVNRVGRRAALVGHALALSEVEVAVADRVRFIVAIGRLLQSVGRVVLVGVAHAVGQLRGDKIGLVVAVGFKRCAGFVRALRPDLRGHPPQAIIGEAGGVAAHARRRVGDRQQIAARVVAILDNLGIGGRPAIAKACRKRGCHLRQSVGAVIAVTGGIERGRAVIGAIAEGRGCVRGVGAAHEVADTIIDIADRRLPQHAIRVGHRRLRGYNQPISLIVGAGGLLAERVGQRAVKSRGF